MSTRTVRTAYGSVIALLLAGLVAAAAWQLQVSDRASEVQRDGARISDLLRWRQILADYRTRNPGKAFPTPDQREQAFAELEKAGAPTPPTGGQSARKTTPPPNKQGQARYRYAADQPGEFYVMCAPLERPAQQAGNARQETAYFVTAGGAFTANAENCSSRVQVRAANFVTATALTTEAANLQLRIPTTIESKERIRELCAGSRDTSTAVYGCFRQASPEDSIAILEITDPGLSSQTDVVAAHELLHAAYGRLQPGERAQLDEQLAKQAAQPGFEVLAEELSLYTEAERPGELHSRLATEYAGLAPELERHYARYFRTRAPLVAKHEPYRELLAGLRGLERRLTQSRERLEGLLANGEVDAYNAEVGPYNRLVAQYNTQANRYNLLTR